VFPTCRGRHVTIKAPMSQPLYCGMLFKRANVELRAYPKSVDLSILGSSMA
jgi:hypothetical protein